MSNDTVGRTLLVAFLLCIVCSVFVSAAAVGLRDQQKANQAAEIKRNILTAAGYADQLAAGEPINTLFARIDARLVDLETGEYVEQDPATYNARKAAKDSKLGLKIPAELDQAGIKRRARLSPVYLVKKEDAISRIILPVHGKGLWSTMYGFIALNADTQTVASLSFYEHGETPGLGGEIDNPRWRASWVGKTWADEAGTPIIDVVKGQVNPADPKAGSQIDGLSGATLTANGVEYTMRYWAGEHGFGPYLAKIRGQK